MTERESIKNEVLAIVAEAHRRAIIGIENAGYVSCGHPEAIHFLESKITKESLDLPKVDWECVASHTNPLNCNCNESTRLLELARLIISGRVKIVEVDK